MLESCEWYVTSLLVENAMQPQDALLCLSPAHGCQPFGIVFIPIGTTDWSLLDATALAALPIPGAMIDRI